MHFCVLNRRRRFARDVHLLTHRSQEEAVPESLKNILLVMSSGGYLEPPSSGQRTPQQEKLWAETWERLQKFLPGLMPELFPEATEQAVPENKSYAVGPADEAKEPGAVEAKVEEGRSSVPAEA